MVKNIYEVPENSLGTLDAHGHRIARIPVVVHGFYRNWRTITQIILIVIFLILPWMKINGIQAVLLDLPNRRFNFFGLSFWGHDSPMVFFVFVFFSFGLAFVTSVWGRVWCGWACPQTVFIDGVFRRIETFIEGNHIERRKLQQTPFNREKIIKKTVEWFLFFLVCSLLCHTFLAYFVGAEKLAGMILHSPFENWTYFLIVSISTIALMVNFSWFREQLCIIMCPYGRLQAVLMDENSLAVVYDEKRGEPRKGSVPDKEKSGDCINCFKCVAACPTGIDIRRGIQMECIACTACIDACDEVMVRVKKPKGLIRYDSENGLKGKNTRFWHARTFIYSGIILFSLLGLFFTIVNRSDLDITLLRVKDKPYQVFRTEETVIVTNHYMLNLKNQGFTDINVDVELSEEVKHSKIELIAPAYPADISAGNAMKNHLYLKFPKSTLGKTGQKMIALQIIAKTKDTTKRYNKEMKLVGPAE